eukprot:UN03191
MENADGSDSESETAVETFVIDKNSCQTDGESSSLILEPSTSSPVMKRIPATNKTKLKKRRSEENVRAALENANAPPVITRKRSGSGGDSKGLKRRRSEKKEKV